ncbi:jg4450 [Pararge aegeria aegeria]|uniref:Jg4450 protein n=1 Tax=Pararge aegeria aegeria TaxID=348720 RepID=A0A8S4S519_9NEOP|nr:jg4450 [Pararge aegeria aegeria]
MGPQPRADERLPATCLIWTVHLVGGDQRCAYQFGDAIPAPWDPNVHPFSELCAPPIATSASRLIELCR